VTARERDFLAARREPSGRYTRLGDDRGVALTEFALILPLLMVLFLGMLDLGKAFNYWIDETHLANQGARWAVVNKNPGGTATPPMSLQRYIASKANTDELKKGGTESVPAADRIEVCISFPSGSQNVGEPVQVTATAEYHWIPLVGEKLPFPSTTISGQATMRLEAKPVNYVAGCERF
jgi:hypothetical protein